MHEEAERMGEEDERSMEWEEEEVLDKEKIYMKRTEGRRRKRTGKVERGRAMGFMACPTKLRLCRGNGPEQFYVYSAICSSRENTKLMKLESLPDLQKFQVLCFR